MGKREVKVSKKRQVNTYAYPLNASEVMLRKAYNDQQGSIHHVMASVIFIAFTMEAYLNHLGLGIFECWDDVERQLSPLSKLNFIAEKLGIKRNKGGRPYQTVSEVFTFRNLLAQVKSELLKSRNEIRFVDDRFEPYTDEPLKTNWENLCTKKDAIRALTDIKAIDNSLVNGGIIVI